MDVRAILTRKLGPLPTWGWALAGGAAVAVLYLRGRQSPAAAQATDITTDSRGDVSSPFVSPLVLNSSAPPSPATSSPPSGLAQTATAVVTAAFSGGQDTGLRVAPSFSAAMSRRVPAGTNLNLVGSLIPDPVNQGQGWYKTSSGDYAWAADLSNVQSGMGGGGLHTAGSGVERWWGRPHVVVA